MRIEKPESGNKYYIRKENGGWSPAIKGRPADSDCNVLPNCVGYAIGRFNEIAGVESCKYLKSATAKRMIDANPTMKVRYTPQVGAVMVWKNIGTGHCAIVEKIINENEVITSESFYGSIPFINLRRTKGEDDNWGAIGNAEFLGFIYQPKAVTLVDKDVEARDAKEFAEERKREREEQKQKRKEERKERRKQFNFKNLKRGD